ncbi:hypothetical protein EJ08DRAFT_737315 [Tothia fuscella]|uniref:AA9 family lytic polysaccharide monooxygenase n=1 Tax=Tothia fuscella TaxID=1048955 RepID=A0A9P4NJW9_9PEZI|nr:hypothetical protein EJ08DRAFT_737315 [Tothia fuscella]
MKSFAIAACAAACLLEVVSGHYIFQQVGTGGSKGAVYDHVRKNTNHNSPVTDLNSKDLRCNVGGASGESTTNLPVTAGSTVTYSSDTKVYHQGPVSFYMTKVSDAKTADGSTKWFKIKDIGPSFAKSGGDWSATQQQSFPVTIPKCIPSGEYLLRIQQIGLHNPGGDPQFYVSCAQLTVSGGSGAAVPAGVSIPGAFSKSDPGYKVNIYNGFSSYTIPGPPVVKC